MTTEPARRGAETIHGERGVDVTINVEWPQDVDPGFVLEVMARAHAEATAYVRRGM